MEPPLAKLVINTHTDSRTHMQCKSPSNPYITIGCPRSPKSSRSMIRPGIVQAHNPLAQQASHELVFIFLSVWACPPTWHINLRFLHTLNNCRQSCHAAPSLHYRKPRLLSLPCFSISLKIAPSTFALYQPWVVEPILFYPLAVLLAFLPWWTGIQFWPRLTHYWEGVKWISFTLILLRQNY